AVDRFAGVRIPADNHQRMIGDRDDLLHHGGIFRSLTVDFDPDLLLITFGKLPALAERLADPDDRLLAVFTFDEAVRANLHAGAADIGGEFDKFLRQLDVLLDDTVVDAVILARGTRSQTGDRRVGELLA